MDIDIVMRQTTFTEEEVIEKLKSKDSTQIIREYMGISEKVSTPLTINQEIYKQIRNKLSIENYNNIQKESLAQELK